MKKFFRIEMADPVEAINGGKGGTTSVLGIVKAKTTESALKKGRVKFNINDSELGFVEIKKLNKKEIKEYLNELETNNLKQALYTKILSYIEPILLDSFSKKEIKYLMAQAGKDS